MKDTGTHTVLPALCEEIGMPAPAADGSKRERMASMLRLRLRDALDNDVEIVTNADKVLVYAATASSR